MALNVYNNDNGITTQISSSNQASAYFYDTRLDSDGGAWRRKTQDTSWYREAASATRGARRDFPMVALIAVENAGSYWRVVIYDADDPAFPMWMIFNGGVDMSNETMLRGTTIRDAKMKNGLLVISTSDTAPFIDFITEEHRLGHTAAWYWFPERQTLYDRNRAITEPQISYSYSRLAYGSGGTGGGLGESNQHQVEMELPAPGTINNSRLLRRKGLPYPQVLCTSRSFGTAYVVFDGDMDSISVTQNQHGYPSTLHNYWKSPKEAVAIHNGPSSGQSLDVYQPTRMSNFYLRGASTNGGNYSPDHGWHNSLSSYPNTRSYAFSGGLINAGAEIPIQALGFGGNGPYGMGTVNNYSYNKRDDVHIVEGTQALTLIKENEDDPRNGLACIMRQDYTTGWMQGNTVLALDAQNDTNMSGTNLLSNSYDPTNTNNWSVSNTGTLSVVGGAFRITSTSYAGIYQTISVTPGTSYLVSACWRDVNGTYSSQGIDIRVKEGAGTSGATVVTSSRGGDGGFNSTFTVPSGVTQVTVNIIPGRGSVNTGVSEVNRIRVTEMFINDKSVYQHRMHVTGTVSRGTIPGSDISFFHNFGSGIQTNTSEASQLVIPAYNTYLDPNAFGADTGYCVSAWVYVEGDVNGFEGIMSYGNADSSEGFTLGIGTSYNVYLDYGLGGDYSTLAQTVEKDRWIHICAYVSPRQIPTIYIDGRLMSGINNSAGYNVRNRMNRTDFMGFWDYQLVVGNIRGGGFSGLQAANLRIALPKISQTIPNDSDVKFIYDQEKAWFQAGAGNTGYSNSKAYTIVGNSALQEIDYDIHRNEYVLVGTNGVEVRKGLSRLKSIGAGNSYDVAAIHDGKVVYGT